MTSYRQMMWPVQAYHWSFLFESQKNGLAGHFRLAEQYFGHPWFNPLKICGLTNEKITCIDLLRRGRLTPQGLGYLSVCLFFFCCLTMTGAPLRIGWAIVEPSTKKIHFKNRGGGGGKKHTNTYNTKMKNNVDVLEVPRVVTGHHRRGRCPGPSRGAEAGRRRPAAGNRRGPSAPYRNPARRFVGSGNSCTWRTFQIRDETMRPRLIAS